VEPPAFERPLHLEFAGREGDSALLVKPKSSANLTLLCTERILDAARRVGPDVNRYQTVLPG
jgi:hypothetical protein